MASGSGGKMPTDADIMKNILKLFNVTEYEPNVITQMLEFVYRYVTTILEDAALYSSYAKKKAIDSEDVKLAIRLLQTKNFTPVPSREVTAELARHTNSKPLAGVRSSFGLNLPSDRNSLTSVNVHLVQGNQNKAMYSMNKLNQNGVPYSGQTKATVVQKTFSHPVGNSPSNSVIKSASNGENKRKREDDESS